MIINHVVVDYALQIAHRSKKMADELLVSAAQSGDSQAFVELSRRHSGRLLLNIYRITNNWQDAEDVVQEALMRTFVHINTFESRPSFSTWLTRIAINTALMLLRVVDVRDIAE